MEEYHEVNQEIFTNPQRIISTMDGDYDVIGGHALISNQLNLMVVLILYRLR